MTGNLNRSRDKGKNTNTSPDYIYKTQKGLNKDIVKQISAIKQEPEWMKEFRLNAYESFLKQKLPQWAEKLVDIDFQDIYYYLRPTDNTKESWEDVPDNIKETFEKLGIPQAEREFLSGVKAQFESEIVYGSLKEELEEQGVIFSSTETALNEHSELFKEYFGKIVPPQDNKMAALNSAVWSGGSFVYIPKGVKVKRPLQAYFRINAQKMGQFERTLIIADEGSEVHYVEGCTAPTYSSDALHAAVVEVVVKTGARVRYTTVQNWSTNVYNLVTKRAFVEENARMEWVDGNIGSKVTMKYPTCYLKGKGAHGEMLSIAYGSAGQFQDVGARMIHEAPNTSSSIISRSISKNGGTANYRGLVEASSKAKSIKSRVKCDSLIMDEKSVSNSYPTIISFDSRADIEHEASIRKVEKDKLFYLTSRGFTEEEALNAVVSGFIEPIVSELPLEYALELNTLIEMEMQK